jgi:phosphoglycerol transferase MdoB-like AlkP superfamily enzyme
LYWPAPQFLAVKDRIKVIVVQALFWLLFFVCSRILFLLYHLDLTFSLQVIDVVTLNLFGLRLDLSMAAYALALSTLLLSIPKLKPNTVATLNFVVVAILLFFFSVIVAVDLELYTHWGYRMTTTPLLYVSKEAFGSVNPAKLILITGITFTLFLSFLFLYKRFVHTKFAAISTLTFGRVPQMVFILLLLFLPIRGGIGVAPINTGVVYFHKWIPFANHAGVNVVWNFLRSATGSSDIKYPDNFAELTHSQSVIKSIHHGNHPSKSLLKTNNPNVLIIVLESFTSKVIGPLGGLPNVTPQLNQLVKEGVLFDRFFASGDRTDKGLISILSAYPSQPKTSLIKYPEKTQRLPFITKSFSQLGYTTSFTYGGNIGFANMESYLTNASFDQITEDDDFDSELDNSKWGVADHYVFEKLLEECNEATLPWFKVMLTLSSHEPFEVPMETVIMGEDEQSKFLNSCYYTDKSLGKFIETAKLQPWWENTLVVITADHGHRLPNDEAWNSKERFKIPMLWLGGALNVSDTVIHTIGSQTDIANTLLGQINRPNDSFAFSRDLFDGDIPPFAIYVFNNGYGYIDDQGESIYDFDFGKFVMHNTDSAGLMVGKGYMQALFTDYNSRAGK